MNASYCVVIDKGLNTGSGPQQTVIPVESLSHARDLLGSLICGQNPLLTHTKKTDVLGVREDHFLVVDRGLFGTVKNTTRVRVALGLDEASAIAHEAQPATQPATTTTAVASPPELSAA